MLHIDIELNLTEGAQGYKWYLINLINILVSYLLWRDLIVAIGTYGACITDVQYTKMMHDVYHATLNCIFSL